MEETMNISINPNCNFIIFVNGMRQRDNNDEVIKFESMEDSMRMVQAILMNANWPPFKIDAENA